MIGSELVQKYVGEGARMVRELFRPRSGGRLVEGDHQPKWMYASRHPGVGAAGQNQEGMRPDPDSGCKGDPQDWRVQTTQFLFIARPI